MKADFTELIRAGRVLECHKASDLTDIADTGKPCSIFVSPITLEVGDVVIATASFPYAPSGDDVPMVVGDWSPVIVNGVTAFTDAGGNALTLGTDFDLYYAPIEINDR